MLDADTKMHDAKPQPYDGGSGRFKIFISYNTRGMGCADQIRAHLEALLCDEEIQRRAVEERFENRLETLLQKTTRLVAIVSTKCGLSRRSKSESEYITDELRSPAAASREIGEVHVKFVETLTQFQERSLHKALSWLLDAVRWVGLHTSFSNCLPGDTDRSVPLLI